MELVPIGEAARMLKVNASALRYYEERGLVKPACRVNGRRMYGRAELRRLAFEKDVDRPRQLKQYELELAAGSGMVPANA